MGVLGEKKEGVKDERKGKKEQTLFKNTMTYIWNFIFHFHISVLLNSEPISYVM